MKRLIALLAAVLMMYGTGLASAAGTTTYHHETAYARADVRLYMQNDTNVNYLSNDNDSEGKDIRLATAYVISTSIDFELVYNGWNLSEDLNFTDNGVAYFTIWLRGSREARGLRLGAEVGAGNKTRSCGRADGLINLGTAAEAYDVGVPLTSDQLKKEENLKVSIYIDYIGLPIGMPLAVDLLTGGNRTNVVLPVENYARLVMDLKVDEGKRSVDFSADADGPFRASFMMHVDNFILTGPTTPKSVDMALMLDLYGIWKYGQDNAQEGKYVFEASYETPSGQLLKDSIFFELPGPADGLGGQTIWFVLVLLIIMIVVSVCIILVRRRMRSR